MMKRFMFSLVTVLLLSSFAAAQVATGSLSGTVKDQTGGAVPGARLVATNTASGVKSETLTSDAGLYVIPSLPVGMYEVSVEITGFKKLNRGNVEIRIATRQELDLTLDIGNMQETVVVTEEVPLLETTSSQRGQGLSTQFMNTLPFFSGGIRNPRTFVNYMPGANPSTELSVSGSGGRAQEVLIDGASATIPESGGVSFNFPAAEMFGEFKLLTSTFDAEYGRFGGGVELYVTKSGTNEFHGTAFLNMRRDIWNANAWAFNASGRARPKERFNEIGVATGGPVWIPKLYDGRNKTFYYFTYSKDKRPVTSTAVLSTVPTARMKQGDFGELPASQIIYDPATTSGNTRTPFPNNIIPQSRFSQIARNLIAAIPDPTRSTLTGNFDNVNETVFDKYIWNLKLDHAFTPGNRLAFTMTKEKELSGVLAAFPGPLGQGLETFQRPDNWRWNHDLVLSPTILLHTTFGYSRTRQLWDNPYQKSAASKFGFPGITGDSDAMPRVIFSGADALTQWGVADGKVANGSQINITNHLTQSLSWIRGAHEFKMGWDFRRLHTTSDPIDLAGTNGRYTFARAQTALPTNLSGTGHAFASLLLGLPDLADRVALPVLIGNIRYGYHAAWFQDNWKVNPRLTLSLGMRYDLPINWHDKNGDYSGMDRQIPNPGAGGLPGAMVFFGKGPGRTGDKRPYPTDYSNFGPRLGLSYRITDKTVLRGGYGIFYQTLGNGGCGCRIGFANPITLMSDGLNGALNWDTGIAAPPGFRPPPVLDPEVGNFNNVDVFSENFGRAPRIHSWSINIQHEVSKFLFDIAYVANRGRGLNSTVLLNQLPVSRLSLGSLLQRRIDDPAVVAAGYTKPYASFPDDQTLAQALRPYPQYFDISERNAGIGRTWYDSMQAKVERRFGNWQLMGAYTWSKSLGVAHYRQIFSQNFATSGHNIAAQDNYHYDEDKSFLPFDLTHVFNFLSSYVLPFGKGKRFMNTDNFAANLLISDWTISTLQQYRSGGLILVQAPANTLGTGVLFTQFKKANLGTGAIQTGIDRTTLDPNNPSTRWFNAAAFTPPGQFELGNAAHYFNDFRNPPVFQENVSLQKRMRFPVKSDRSLDLIIRVDAFNVFNRTNFGGIVGTIGNANFGRPTGPQIGARIITMGARLDF
jgi:Carboxypeptidase regulatory-like domain/TonB dependent receptor-like, beta-barrel